MDNYQESEGRSAQEWRDVVYAFERRGMLYFAYDAALQGLDTDAGRGDRWLRHRAVLALVRAGASEAALEAFDDLSLADSITDPEVAALDARLKKELALKARPEVRAQLLASSAAAYFAIHERGADSYPAINAATLWLLAGEPERASALAEQAVSLASADKPTSALGEYFQQATVAEGRLVLGDLEGARVALERAAAVQADDWAARASTRQQLRLIAAYAGHSLDVLEPLAVPPVLHYCGHMISDAGRMRHGDEGAVAAAIDAELNRLRPGIAYGSLASGADLMFVENLLARGAEVSAVLPFKIDDFVRVSVAPAGDAWVNRFNAVHEVLQARDCVMYVTDDDYVGDDNLFLYADEFSMGLTLLRAGHIDAAAEQITVWDGATTEHVAGTYAARKLWERTGKAQSNVQWRSSGVSETPQEPHVTAGDVERHRCALLFGDFKGFSKLPDRLLPVYVEKVLGAVQAVIGRYPVEVSNTWGDAVYLVLKDVGDAAQCALELQVAVREIPWTQLGFEAPLQFRLGGHYGPVYRAVDPILKTTTYVGAHVSRAARVEPVTPPGGVYVTEQFATKLALGYGDRFDCDYVGVRNLPKNYGRLPLHLVRPRPATKT
jgi:class 3 adenylate cyclase